MKHSAQADHKSNESFYLLLINNNTIYCGEYKNLIYFKLIQAEIIHRNTSPMTRTDATTTITTPRKKKLNKINIL